MAIQTVTNENLNEYVAERTVNAKSVQTSGQMVAEVSRVAEIKGVKITSGGESVSTAPEPSGDEPTAKAQVEKAKAGTDPAVQKRIDQLTREKRELDEAFESEYNARILAEQQLRDLKKEPETAPVKAEEKRPRLADFKTAEEFDAAMDVYENTQRDRIRVEAEQAARAQAAVERANEDLGKRYQQAASDIGGDFEEVIKAANESKLTPPEHIQAALREGEYGVHVAYYLAKNPDELKRLEGLSPVRAVAEIGKLEMRFAKSAEAEPEAEKPKARAKPTVETTRAPEPLASVKADASGIVQTDLSQPMEFTAYRQQRMQEIRRKRH
jgi:hypothetical protein